MTLSYFFTDLSWFVFCQNNVQCNLKLLLTRLKSTYKIICLTQRAPGGCLPPPLYWCYRKEYTWSVSIDASFISRHTWWLSLTACIDSALENQVCSGTWLAPSYFSNALSSKQLSNIDFVLLKTKNHKRLQIVIKFVYRNY